MVCVDFHILHKTALHYIKLNNPRHTQKQMLIMYRILLEKKKTVEVTAALADFQNLPDEVTAEHEFLFLIFKFS